MEALETKKVNGLTIKVSFDHDPQNPRTEWDNLGTIIYNKRSRYILGDEALDFDEIEEIAHSKNNIVLPVYAYIHSGIALNTTGFSCPWDSGQSGFIYVTKEKVRSEYGFKRNISPKCKNTVLNVLKSEVQTYSQYITGEAYEFTIENDEGEILECCGGYFDTNYCLDDAIYLATAITKVA